MKHNANQNGPRAIIALAAILTAGFATATADAGTIRHDREDAAYRAYAAQPQFAAVGTYTSNLYGSLTLIAPDWALTAAHVIDADRDGEVDDERTSTATVRIGGQSRGVSQVIVPVGVNGNRGWSGDIGDGYDIALVKLASPITTITPATIYTGFRELNSQVTSVGFGRGGTGVTGASSSTGVKRAGDNIVDRYVTFSNGASAFSTDFDEPAPRVSRNYSGSSVPLDMEYTIASGDSGGGTFIFENGEWLLAGVHSGVYDTFVYPGTSQNGSTYGDATLITRVSAYQQFIFSNIPSLAAAVPEPSSVVVMAIAGAAVVRRRAICR